MELICHANFYHIDYYSPRYDQNKPIKTYPYIVNRLRNLDFFGFLSSRILSYLTREIKATNSPILKELDLIVSYRIIAGTASYGSYDTATTGNQ